MWEEGREEGIWTFEYHLRGREEQSSKFNGVVEWIEYKGIYKMEM